jgi:replicative DNA helicase
MYASLLEKEDTEEGVAEVMLAKHRNGPTGTVKLAFLKQYTRFDNLSARTPEGGNAG